MGTELRSHANLLPGRGWARGRYLHRPQQVLELWLSLTLQRASSLPTPFSQPHPCPAVSNSLVALLSFFHFREDFLLLSPEIRSTQEGACRRA